MNLNNLNLRIKIGSFILIIVFLTFITSFIWTPYDPQRMNIDNRLSFPNLKHPLGTDQYGRDELSRIIDGSGKALMVGFIAVSIGLIAGITLGSIASTSNYIVSEFIMRFIDAIYSLPAVLLALLITTILGPGIRNSIIAIGIFNIPIFARLTNASLLSIKERDYIFAAKSLGVNRSRLVFKHMIPNAASPLIVQSSNSFAKALLAEAGLSYLGLGVQPPESSWGVMLKTAQTFAGRAPHLVLIPGFAIVFTVFGFNIFADGIRDLLDPHSISPSRG